MRRRSIRYLVVLAVLLATQTATAAPASSPADPFAAWNVAVTFDEAEPNVAHLEFDSALLGRRVLNTVTLPDIYFTSPHPLPVAYYLHGTRGLASDDVATWIPRGIESSDLFGGHGTFGHAHAFGSPDRQRFIVVELDALRDGEWPGWCGHCWWVDGRKGIGVLAESHLYEELIPVVEHAFGTRTDRGGRAVMGYSMGGFGALIQAYRHPDRFVLAASFSPTLASEGNRTPLNEAFWAAYLMDQGYPPPAENEILYRNIEPYTLATNAIGTGLDTVILLGDGCITERDGACEGLDPAWNEALYRNASEITSAKLAELGLPHFFIKREGNHGTTNRETFDDVVLPRLNRLFARPMPEPGAFSYKTADRTFDVWDYDVAVDRPNTEFLNLLGAQTDGRQFTVAGTGRVTVRTPARFRPGAAHTVRITREDGRWSEQQLAADADGRVEVTLELGSREIDERAALIEAGAFAFTHARVEIAPA